MGICQSKNNYRSVGPRALSNKQSAVISSPDQLIINTVVKNSNKITKEYKIEVDQIGKGAFGEVRKALHIQSGNFRAVKIVYKHECSADEQRKIMKEVEMLTRLDHPNIIKIYEFFEDQKFMYIVMELAQGGELFDKIQSVQRFSERRAAEIFHQILSGVNYLHKHRIVHRDLKPENILFDGEVIKIVDFGTSKNIESPKMMKKCHGTPYYVAPEVLNENYNEKCDVWSCGVILYLLLTGIPPFNGHTEEDILGAVVKGSYSMDIPEFRQISKTVKTLIRKMLTYDPEERISVGEALNNEWFKIVLRKEEKLVTKDVLSNIRDFNTKNKMQKSIFYFLVNQLASNEERRALISTFKALDTNNDGELNKEELVAGFCRADMNLTEADVETLIERIDNNKSKTIDYTEFVAAAIDKRNLLSEDRMRSCFNMFDKDNSGRISINEIKAIMQGNNVVSDSVWEDMMEQIDENGDGEIEYSEFKNLLLKMVK